MREDLPAGVLDMLRTPGLRQERVRKLYKELGIASAADLEDAAQSGRLAATKGFGAAFQAKVLQGIEVSRGPQGRHLIAPTRPCASPPMRSPVVSRLLAI